MDQPDAETDQTGIPQTLDSSSNGLLKPVRKLLVFVLGMSVLVIGIAMIILPGPAFVVIPLGLTILATEFLWARRWLNYLKRRSREVAEWTARQASSTPTQPDSPKSPPKANSSK